MAVASGAPGNLPGVISWPSRIARETQTCHSVHVRFAFCSVAIRKAARSRAAFFIAPHAPQANGFRLALDNVSTYQRDPLINAPNVLMFFNVCNDVTYVT